MALSSLKADFSGSCCHSQCPRKDKTNSPNCLAPQYVRHSDPASRDWPVWGLDLAAASPLCSTGVTFPGVDGLCILILMACAYPTAQRLARYQEMDLEEEDVLPRGSSLPQRSSLDSPQTLHRSHSTRSHHHPGFRAEGHRASVQSHTAFSSPMVSGQRPNTLSWEEPLSGMQSLPCWGWLLGPSTPHSAP